MSSGAGVDGGGAGGADFEGGPVVQPMFVHVQPFRDGRQFVVRRYGSSCNPFVSSLRCYGFAGMSQVKTQSEFSRAIYGFRTSAQSEL